MSKTAQSSFVAMLMVAMSFAPSASAQSAEEIARLLANPLADLTSVPLTFNFDDNVGEDGDAEFYGNIQAIVPFEVAPSYNILSRTILPIGSADPFVSSEADLSGIGDIEQAFFFAPKKPNFLGWHWGIGPALILPTGEDEENTSGKWSAGVSSALVRQFGNWTAGAVHRHVWSFAGDSDRSDVNESLLDPFLVFTTATATSYFVNAPVQYDWHDRDWAAPVQFGASQLVFLGSQPVEIGAAARYWVESPDGGPEDWGARLTLTFPFPR